MILKYLNNEQLLGPKLIVDGCQGNGSKHLEAVSHFRLSANIDTNSTTKSITASAHCIVNTLGTSSGVVIYFIKQTREFPLFEPFSYFKSSIDLLNRQRTESLTRCFVYHCLSFIREANLFLDEENKNNSRALIT